MKDHSEVTLFLVEDDDIDAMAVERALHKVRIGNPLVRARDGQEAYEMLKDNEVSKPFVILLDLRLPRVSGLEFLDMLRADEDLMDAVTFILTTSKADEDVSSAYKKQIAGYFLKDDSGEGIFDVVQFLSGYWKIAYLP